MGGEDNHHVISVHGKMTTIQGLICQVLKRHLTSLDLQSPLPATWKSIQSIVVEHHQHEVVWDGTRSWLKAFGLHEGKFLGK